MSLILGLDTFRTKKIIMDEDTFKEALKRILPEIVYSEMDGGVFWKSLEEYKTGDVIQHKNKSYTVLYGWHWTTWRGVPIYFAELEPMEVEHD